jgi:hypothetical protein
MTDGEAGACAVCLSAQPERKLTTSKATAENCLFMCFVLKICIGVYWAMLRAVPAAGLNCTAQANQITTAAVTSKHNRASFSSDDRLGVAANRVE